MISVDLPSPTSNYEPRTVRSVSHAIQLMRFLADAPGTLTLSFLARKVGLSKPAVYNLLNSLVAEDLVRRDPAGGYRLAWGTYELGSTVAEAQEIARAARNSMQRLAASVPGAALLSVADRDRVLYVDREQDDPAFFTVAGVGHRSPLHATASGKVLLAFLERRDRDRILSMPLAASTTTTVTDRAALEVELIGIRDKGYASCWGEHEPRLSSLAVPVFDKSKRLRASIAVALSTERLRRGSPAAMVDRLRDAAEGIRVALN